MTATRRLILACACAATVSVTPTSAQQVPVFSSRATAVLVNVLVHERNAPVTTLASTDFALTDNGVPQTLEVEPADALPCDLTLVLDMSGSTLTVVQGYKDDVRSIAKMLRPADRVRLLTFDTQVREVFPFESAAAGLQLDQLRAGGTSALLDGLLFALPRTPNPDRQHLVVMFTDGANNSSLVNAKTVADAAARSDGLLEIAVTSKVGAGQSSGIPIIYSVVGEPQPAGGWVPILRSIAATTGGEVRDADKSGSLKKTFETLFADIRRSYVLRFIPTGVAGPGWHDLVVTVPGHPTYKVQARRGYFGG
jgi:VWFA-related protein